MKLSRSMSYVGLHSHATMANHTLKQRWLKMKNVRLKTLKLRNFKGIRELDVNFNLLDASIYGKNGTGKTTVADAFMWLLFNKDSNGASDFDVKTKKASGEYLHYLEHSVEGVFELNGSQLSMKKVLKEKYTKKRGSSTEEFTGHETSYFIDDVPKKKGEFDAIVNEAIDRDVFQLITDPLYFNDDKRFNWKNRRSLLIDICGDVSDAEVMASDRELNALANELNGKSVDDYRAMLKSKMTPVNQELKEIPIKINEAQLAIPAVDEFHLGDEERLNEVKAAIEAKEKEKFNIMNGGTIADKETELIKLKNKKLLILDESCSAKTRKLNNERCKVEQKRNELRSEYSSLKYDIDAKRLAMDRNIARRDSLRKEYADVNESSYDESKNICPTCNQPLPQEQIEGFIELFNLDKAKRLEKINAEGVRLKEEYTKLEADLHEEEQKLSELEAEGNKAKAELEELQLKIKNIDDEHDADKKKRASAVDVDIQRVENELNEIRNNNSELVAKVDAQINVLKQEKQKYDTKIANRLLAERQHERIQQLIDQEKALSNDYQRMDKLLYLTDLFVKTKVSMLSEKINSHFKLCNFRLFEEQINGGLNECCEVTVNGVNYSDLNNAMKINAGLDVINAICDYRNMYAPIFIDNCEAVNAPLQTQSQQIRLYVTDADEELRIGF